VSYQSPFRTELSIPLRSFEGLFVLRIFFNLSFLTTFFGVRRATSLSFVSEEDLHLGEANVFPLHIFRPVRWIPSLFEAFSFLPVPTVRFYLLSVLLEVTNRGGSLHFLPDAFGFSLAANRFFLDSLSCLDRYIFASSPPLALFSRSPNHVPFQPACFSPFDFFLFS